MLGGAVAQTVLELDVHVIYGVLIRYGRARGDVILLLGIDVEYVMMPTGGGLLFGSVVLVHVQYLLGENDSALGYVVGFVVEVQQDRPATRFELVPHEERIVIT